MTRELVVSMVLLLSLLSGCTEAEPPDARSYDSAEQIAADLEAHDSSWSCVDAGSLPGFLSGPDVDSAQQCTRDDLTATVRVMKEGELPTFRRTADPPHSWWVAAPNWFVATTSEELAHDIQEALGGRLKSSKL